MRVAADAAGSALLSAAVGLGARLNTLTGYNVIEQQKAKVDEADAGLARAREALRASKAAYDERVAEHGDAQRQLMSLLQRKSSWGRADLDCFTSLCSRELELERAVAEAKSAHSAAAEELEAAHAAVLRAIRERYAAETLWSDKIRRASTWWTAGLMGLNLASFLSVYLVMEPVKAARLRSYVEEVFRRELAALRGSVDGLQAALTEARAPAAAAGDANPPPAAAAAATAYGQGVGRGSGGGGPGGGPEGDPTAAVVPEVRQLRRQLAEVERRVAEVAGGLADQVAAMRALTAAVAPLGGGATSAAGLTAPGATPAASTTRAQEQERGQQREGGAPPAATGPVGHGHVPVAGSEEEAAAAEAELRGGWRARALGAARRAYERVARCGGWLGGRLRQAAATPEAASAAAAFTGAVLGGGLLVLLDRRR